MKSKRLTLSVLCMVAAVAHALACTNLIVGKNASTDGSTIVSYSADSYGLFGELYHYPAGVHKKGTLMDVHEWDTGNNKGQICFIYTPAATNEADSLDLLRLPNSKK